MPLFLHCMEWQVRHLYDKARAWGPLWPVRHPGPQTHCLCEYFLTSSLASLAPMFYEHCVGRAAFFFYKKLICGLLMTTARREGRGLQSGRGFGGEWLTSELLPRLWILREKTQTRADPHSTPTFASLFQNVSFYSKTFVSPTLLREG